VSLAWAYRAGRNVWVAPPPSTHFDLLEAFANAPTTSGYAVSSTFCLVCGRVNLSNGIDASTRFYFGAPVLFLWRALTLWSAPSTDHRLLV